MEYRQFIIPFLSAGLAFAAAAYWFKRNVAQRDAERLATEADQLRTRVSELEMQLGSVRQTILPLSAVFQAALIKELTHYHTPVLDKLLEKVGDPSYALTDHEDEELRVALIERTKDMGDEITDSERDAAHILPIVIKRVKAEAAALAKEVSLQTVAIVEPVGSGNGVDTTAVPLDDIGDKEP